MSQIHFVHTTDWHLGFYQYNKPERFTDYFNAATKAIDKIIEINPQFVLHTGDIFHHAKPAPATIRQAVQLLQKLDQANIPMYIVRGNHDGKNSVYLRRGGGIISLLKDFELLRYVNDEIIQIDDLPCQLMGVGYYPGTLVVKKIDAILSSSDKLTASSDYKIIAIHAFVEGQLEETSQISLKKISSLGIDYLAAGHYHKPWMDDKKKVYAPGSTEMTAISDATRDDNIDGVSLYSTMFEVKATTMADEWQHEVIPHKIAVRPKIMLNYRSEMKSTETIRDELEQKIEEKIDVILLNEPSVAELQPILSVDLKTDLAFEEYSQLYIEEWYQDEFLHIITNIDGKTNSMNITADLGQSFHREEVILELIEAYDLDKDKHATMIMELLEDYSDQPKSRDLADDVFNDITKLILEQPRDQKHVEDGTTEQYKLEDF